MINKLMSLLITQASETKNISHKKRESISLCVDKIIRQIKIIKNCMIIKNPTFDVYNEKMFIQIFNDSIGFESSQNELNLNLELREDLLSPNEALYFFNRINQSIKKTYPNNEYCAILHVNNLDEWIYRFHIIRNNSLWIDENLEAYNEPIMYERF